METSNTNYRDMIRGISVCNPVDIDPEYFMYTVDYAIKNSITHIQFIGPIHNYIKGNIDGITPYRKYSRYNGDKDTQYMNYNLEHLNAGCEKAHNAGIKMYMWHHELDLPDGFSADYPEILGSDGDIEVTHPLVKDFLENRIADFFAAYPYMDGIILTLHETKVPILRLKNQKLDKVERVKYVTEILYNTCRSLGKELIVRPFASVEKDYEMMTKAYESISTDLLIMDKWTQFDWSLCLPHNKFFNKIKKNPIFVETDIFGEYFGKGRIPIMLKNHIIEKFEYCEGFTPAGYVNRIDRGGRHPFGSVNEVNLDIMNACMQGKNTDTAIDEFFERTYPECAEEMREIMEPTEQILREIIWLKGYYFSELSAFPRLNHCKNHFYFEMMKDEFCIASEEWFIPQNWQRGSIESVMAEKQHAVDTSAQIYEKLLTLKSKMSQGAFDDLHKKFANLKYIARVWNGLVKVFFNYAKYFEKKDEKYITGLENAYKELTADSEEAFRLLGIDFYCRSGVIYGATQEFDYVKSFIDEVKVSFEAEKKMTDRLESEKGLVDFIVCGGANEAHKLQKEVNFSDTFVSESGLLYRIPGTGRGASWSVVNTHGWFSYEIAVKPHKENLIKILLGTHLCDCIDIKIELDGKEYTVSQNSGGKPFEYIIPYCSEKSAVRIRFDRFTANTPCVHTIKVCAE
ncbi:MAG: hypothetical protein E7588_10130 [Ruminococcaceae bacterium]|nr:hypothetical protein [Oscillospiraceae bacterium]